MRHAAVPLLALLAHAPGIVDPVGRLGEGAFWVVTSDNKMGLHVGKGKRRAILEVLVGGNPNIPAALKLAEAVLARL